MSSMQPLSRVDNFSDSLTTPLLINADKALGSPRQLEEDADDSATVWLKIGSQASLITKYQPTKSLTERTRNVLYKSLCLWGDNYSIKAILHSKNLFQYQSSDPSPYHGNWFLRWKFAPIEYQDTLEYGSGIVFWHPDLPRSFDEVSYLIQLPKDFDPAMGQFTCKSPTEQQRKIYNYCRVVTRFFQDCLHNDGVKLPYSSLDFKRLQNSYKGFPNLDACMAYSRGRLYSILGYMCFQGSENGVRKLLDFKADATGNRSIASSVIERPIIEACNLTWRLKYSEPRYTGRDVVFHLLLEAGAEPNVTSSKRTTLYRELMQSQLWKDYYVYHHMLRLFRHGLDLDFNSLNALMDSSETDRSYRALGIEGQALARMEMMKHLIYQGAKVSNPEGLESSIQIRNRAIVLTYVELDLPDDSFKQKRTTVIQAIAKSALSHPSQVRKYSPLYQHLLAFKALEERERALITSANLAFASKILEAIKHLKNSLDQIPDKTGIEQIEPQLKALQDLEEGLEQCRNERDLAMTALNEHLINEQRTKEKTITCLIVSIWEQIKKAPVFKEKFSQYEKIEAEDITTKLQQIQSQKEEKYRELCKVIRRMDPTAKEILSKLVANEVAYQATDASLPSLLHQVYSIAYKTVFYRFKELMECAFKWDATKISQVKFDPIDTVLDYIGGMDKLFWNTVAPICFRETQRP